MAHDKHKLKLIFIDIIRGYSIGEYEGQRIFIKHHTNLDAGDIDYRKQEFKNKAVKSGLPTVESQEKYIIKENLWSKDKDNEIVRSKEYINALKQTKSKLFKESEIKELQNTIDNENIKLINLINEKKELIGFTAEDYASKKINEYYMFISLFKDKNLEKSFFTEYQFDDLDNRNLFNLINIYNKTSEDFKDINLKKIALSPFYLSVFNLCDDNIYNLHGKAALFLTFYQIELFSFARYFKNTVSNAKHKPPDNYYEDPDKLIEWVESSKNIEEVLDKGNTKQNDKALVATSIVGASKEDLKKAGLDQSSGISLMEEAKKKGGKLNMQDLMKLHGL